MDNASYFTVTDLKQYGFCARVVYYERCLPHVRPRTYKMDAGRDLHEDEPQRAIRRTLSRYEVVEGERFFNVALRSENLSLTGIVDEVVRASSGEVFPVDYKLAKQVSAHYRLQLAAYALLLEEVEQIAISHGFVYLIPKRRLVKVSISPKLRAEVIDILTQLRKLVDHERMPSPTANSRFCTACEFRRFCNDV
jgi:CRISPR-associated exonuclease Cas4